MDLIKAEDLTRGDMIDLVFALDEYGDADENDISETQFATVEGISFETLLDGSRGVTVFTNQHNITVPYGYEFYVAWSEFMEGDTPIYDVLTVCGSRGPRIGEEGQPRCAKRFGHEGSHQGFQGSGFERERWGAPLSRDMSFVREWAAAGLKHE